jgi:tetratricopeptide (TPR) repeat protein
LSISWWEFGIFATLYASVQWGLPKAVLKAFYVGCQRLAENNYRAALRYARFVTLGEPLGFAFCRAYLEMDAHHGLGNTKEAVDAARRLLIASLRGGCSWSIVNSIVCTFVNGGRYLEAIHAQGRYSARSRAEDKASEPLAFATTQINRAEAFFNLGETEEALALLEHVRASVEPDPFIRNGHVCLHAWILIHENELERARELLARLELEPLSPVYAAEVHFTRAAFERELGNLEPAIEYAERGLAVSVRPSSERNGLFMIASIEALRGNDARAKAYFVRAVEHHYRGQGADGLFRYAEFLERTEGKAAAEAAYQLLIERDGESALATRARLRLERAAA